MKASSIILPLSLATCIALSACEDGAVGRDQGAHGGQDVTYAYEESDGIAEVRAMRQQASAEPPMPAPAPPPPDGAADPGDETITERLIAYRYDYQLETAATATSGLIDTHRDACLSAGNAVCQVISANIYEQGDRGVSGTLALRAVPAWIEQFRAGLAGEVEAADGRIRHQSQTADDLTAQIYDLEARLNAKRTLRTRLTTLLERPGASVEELVQVERELARLQGDIEASEAQIRVLRGRVSMSALTLNYTSRVQPVTRSAFDPLGDAVRNMAGNFARGLANVLTFLAGSLPWLIVIVPVFWLLSRWLRSLWQKRLAAREGGKR